MSRVELVQEYDAIVPAELAAEIRARALGGPAPGPFEFEDGNEMWDPLGFGCVDAMDPVAWLPSGQRDPDVGAICLPSPCARLLTVEEMEQHVLGRSMRDEEWDLYTRRYSRTCATEVMWEGEAETALDLVPAEPAAWLEAGYSQGLAAYRLGATAPARRSASPFGMLHGRFGGFGGGSLGSGGGSGSRLMTHVKTTGAAPLPAGKTPSRFDPKPVQDGNDRPGGPFDGDDQVTRPREPQPAPIPLPGSFLMLAAAAAALRLPRR